MKTSRASIAVLLFALVNVVSAVDEAIPDYLLSIEGDWIGEGELTTAEGEVIPIREEWTASRTGGEIFSVEGKRTWGEEPQEFRWIFQRNAATELIECEYWHTGMNEPARFQAQFSDNGVDLRVAMGDGEIRVENALGPDGEIEGRVTVTDGAGGTSLSGVVNHRRSRAG